MLRQLRDGLDLYNFLTVLEKNQEHCRDLFVIGHVEKVDSHYIVLSVAPEMSESGTLKQLKEKEILNFFQDFLLDIEDAAPEDKGKLSVPEVMQWLTGQSHRHLLLSERQRFRIVVRFDHNCLDRMPDHTICYPIVSACTKTITFPTAHLNNFEEFQQNLFDSVRCGSGFYRIFLNYSLAFSSSLTITIVMLTLLLSVLHHYCS
ncbi:uncharacterized protein LOC111196516 [Astyanax mexicanus]|uniref:uncharacterized protein LOC111196516 n=1 Tax=Astyanax mexicanus TaxID=7994 RepID=UPI0020CB6477|nr:uncharacterized protein LOC111196516 [Astyanax mexicanus]